MRGPSRRGRRLLPRQDRQPDRRLRSRRRLRPLRAVGRAISRPLHSRPTRPSWCRTCRAPAACAPRTISTTSRRRRRHHRHLRPRHAAARRSRTDAPAVRFDPRKFTWLGSSSSFADDAYVLMVRTRRAGEVDRGRAPAGRSAARRSAAPRKERPAATCRSLLRDTLGLNIKLVAGYPDNGAMFLAVDRGEVNGRTVDFLDDEVAAARTGSSRAAECAPLVQFARATRHPDFPTCRPRASSPTRPARALIETRGAALPDGAPVRRRRPASRRTARRRCRQAFLAVHRRSAIPGRCGAAPDRRDPDRTGCGVWQPSTRSPLRLVTRSTTSARLLRTRRRALRRDGRRYFKVMQ